MAMKMSASGSVEEYISRADDCLAVLEAASQKVEIVFVIRTLLTNLHPHWVPMSAPLLLAAITTIPDLRDGLDGGTHCWARPTPC